MLVIRRILMLAVASLGDGGAVPVKFTTVGLAVGISQG